MKSEDENMEPEKEKQYLTAINKKNPFETPDGYFDGLTERITNQIKLNEFVDTENKFTTPPDYFEELSQQIQSKVYLDNIKAHDSQNGGFEVPDGYFADAAESIQNIIAAKPKTKVLKLHFIRYAAAACILLTATLGVYINIQHNTAVDYQLSQIPSTEIESYLNLHTDGNDLPMLIENIDDDTDLSIVDFELEKTN